MRFLEGHNGSALAADIHDDGIALHQRGTGSAEEKIGCVEPLELIAPPCFFAVSGVPAGEYAGNAKGVHFPVGHTGRCAWPEAERAAERTARIGRLPKLVT